MKELCRLGLYFVVGSLVYGVSTLHPSSITRIQRGEQDPPLPKLSFTTVNNYVEETHHMTMVILSIYQSFITFISEKSKFLEQQTISISTDIFNGVQLKSKSQHQLFNAELTKTSAWFISNLQEASNRSGASKFDDQITETMKVSYKYLSMDDDQWELIGEENNVKVWKCKRPISAAGIKGAEKWPCIKATAVIDTSPRKLADLLMDSSRVHLTNKFSKGRTDVHVIDKSTKIVWNRSRIPYTFKPYDFCTMMHCLQAEPTQSERFIVVGRAIDHHSTPLHNDYTRSEIFIGLTLLSPLKSDSGKTEVTSINHVRYGGLPAFLAHRNSYYPTINYYTHLNEMVKNL